MLRRVAIAVAALLVVAVVAVGALAWSVTHRPLPKTSGELRIAGLSGPVTVQRDARGVPTITADTAQDLFRAQGFVEAQDRFFEMDLRRHITAGRLSELVGDAGFDTDKVVRTMGWRRVAEEELPMLSPATRQYLQAYADGVNAYIHSKSSPSQMALEYSILGLKIDDYDVEDWTPLDSLTWLKAMAWDLRSDYDDELARAQLAGRMSLKQISEIYPDYPFDTHAPILSSSDWSPSSRDASAASAVPSALRATAAPAAQTAYRSVEAALSSIPQLVGSGDGVGSNSWVVSGSLTTTGKPLLANDPHLGVGIPSIWYQVGLQCRQVTEQCPFSESGFGFSGVPGIVIGHNQKIAWGFTNLAPDVSDFYLEQVQGDSSLRDGSWVPMQTRREVIKVAGQRDRTITVRSTRHGPILSDVIPAVHSAGADAPVTGGDRNETYAVALAWTGLTPSRTADAIFELNTAQNFAQFREAAKDFAVPAQNLVYADTDGHIGYQAPGLVPVRASAIAGYPPGYWPAPGWSSAYDWKSWVPFAQMPWVEDPKEGFIITANQAVTRDTTPFLTSEWDYGFRSQQIRSRLTADLRAGKVSAAQMSSIQMDDTSGFAPTLVKALLRIDLKDDPFTREGQALLRHWDYTMPADDSTAGAAAAYFNAVWSNLLRLTFDDELPAGLQADGGDRWMQAVTVMLGNTRSAWWDNKSTPSVVEGRDEILRQAMVAARLELTKTLGKDPADWQWGKLHTLDLTSQVMGGDDVPWFVRWVFNRGGYHMPGGSAIVDANGWDASAGYTVDWAPSMRMVVDLSNFDHSTWVNQTGESGHPASSHYDDQIDAWVKGRTYPWPFTTGAVKDATKDELRLVPGAEDD